MEFATMTDRWQKLHANITETDEKIQKLNATLPCYFDAANSCSDKLDAVKRSLGVAALFGIDTEEAEHELKRIIVS